MPYRNLFKNTGSGGGSERKTNKSGKYERIEFDDALSKCILAGINASEFWFLELHEVNAIIESWREHQEFLQRQEWERMRKQTRLLINIHLQRKYMIHTDEQLLKFPWDKKPEIKKPADRLKEQERIMNKYG